MPLMQPNNVKVIDSLLQQFLPYARKKWGYDTTPDIRLARDPENAKNPLGKTAYYEPDRKRITVYVDGRHPKDIMRSVSHELVHHVQNLRGDLAGTQGVGEQGYAQNNDHLREMEREAYEQGNLCFRDWEDGVKAAHPNMYNEGIKRRKNKVDRFTKRNNLINERLMHKFGLMKENRDHYVQEGDDWYSDEHETMADKKFADAQAAESSLQGADVTIVAGGLAGAQGEVIEMTTSTQGEPAVVVYLRKDADKQVMGKAGDEVIALVSDVEVDKGIQGDDSVDPEDDYNWVGHRAHYQEGTIQEKLAKIFVNNPQYLKVIKESGISREELINRVRGQIQEYGDHETQAQGGMVSSSHSSDPELDQIADIVRTVVEGGGGLYDLKQPLEAEAFDVQATNRFVLVKTTSGDVAIASSKNVELSGDEELIDTPHGQLAVGRINQSMEEGSEGSGYKGWDSTSELERAMSGMSKESFMQVLKDVQKQLGLSDEEMAQKIMKFVNSGSVQEGAGESSMSHEEFANAFDLDPEQDNDGQIIFYASDELGPKLSELVKQAKAAGFDIERNNDGSMTIYTGQYAGNNNVIDGDKPERMWSSIVDNTPMRMDGAIAADKLIAYVAEENPDISPEEIQAFLDSLVQQKSIKRIADEDFGDEYQMMTEGFRGSPEEKEMTSKMSNKEFYKYHTRDKHIVPDLKGDMEPIPGMEGPFQFASGAVLYYDPKVGKYYDRGKDMYLDNEEAAQLTMESESGDGVKVDDEVEIIGGVAAGKTGVVKEPMAGGAVIEIEGGKLVKVKDEHIEKVGYMSGDTGTGEEFMESVVDAIHTKLQEYGYEDDYEDEDPEMAALEKEFPWLSDDGAVDADAEAAAAADAAAAGEFEVAPEEEEEEPTIMKETHDESVFAMGDAIVDALGHEGALENMYKGMGKDEGKENMEHIARHYDIGIPDIGADSGMDAYWEAFDMMRETMGDEEFFDNTIQAMDTQTATDLFEFIMQNYEISVGDDEVEDFDPSKHWQESADDIYDKRNKRLTESLWKWAVK